MNDSERNRIEAFERVKQFSLDNAADFASGVPHTQIGIVKTELTNLQGFTADQAEGSEDAGAAFVNKDTAREDLSDIMHQIARTARMMEYQYGGISSKFHIPRNRTDQDMLATARAWDDQLAEGSTEAHFKTYGMADDFRTVLSDAADAFENSFAPTATGSNERIAATAQIGESIRRGMIALRILDAVMKNLYAEFPGKLAAWISAAHVERASKKKAPATP
jgi:hypothetical protein